MSTVRLYLGGFASIVGVLSLFGLLNAFVCLRKCKRKCCPNKNKPQKLEAEEADDNG
jgi:hypothetical protein